jgi:aldehyde:ferredoxin oxidoreductase
MAESIVRLQDYRALYSSLICCFFSNPPPECIKDLINYFLGSNYDLNAIVLIGERIFNIKRLFNIKMGLSSNNDNIPKILLKTLNEGKVKGKTPNFNKLKKYYYQIRDWDPITGTPNINKLKELELNGL